MAEFIRKAKKSVVMTRETQRHPVLDWIQTFYSLTVSSELTSEFPHGS